MSKIELLILSPKTYNHDSLPHFPITEAKSPIIAPGFFLLFYTTEVSKLCGLFLGNVQNSTPNLTTFQYVHSRLSHCLLLPEVF